MGAVELHDIGNLRKPRTWQARTVIALLSNWRHGRLELRLPDGQIRVFGSEDGDEAVLDVRDWRAFADIVATGDIGFAEGWMGGLWTTPDLAALLRLLALNRDALEPAVYGGWIGRTLKRIVHLLNANTRRGSRRNIAAHYDLGNEFYSLWLDPSMTYSSALFEGDRSRPLREAQEAKYRRILSRLAPKPGARILEIGCGWGGFAEIAARDHGCEVTGLTLSREQLEYATERIARAGLAGQARFELTDYRDVTGSFDHVVSVEMFEAVGESYWKTYFDTIAARLAPGGTALVQAITIAAPLFEKYRAGTDFIQQYIFPGGMLAPPGHFEALAASAGLETTDRHAFGLDYAETLRRWRSAFMARLPDVRAIGFDGRFIRMWEFYLAYCEAGFESRCTDVFQFELRRPR